MSSKEIWNSRLTESLEILKSDEDSYFDCCLILGKEKILVHKSALQLNCSILKIESTFYNSENDIIEIELDMEFADHKDLITIIVSSFYNGEFERLDDLDEMMLVYKFCKFYSVKWLTEVTRKRFISLMKSSKTETEKTDQFLKLFSFAHQIWCTDLMDDSIGLLNDAMIETLINDPSGLLTKLDYHCLKTLTASDKIIAKEEKLFRLLEAWINCQEHVPLSYIELAKQIRYQFIDTPFLMENVMSYVIIVSDVELRKELLKTVQGTITTGGQKFASRAGQLQLEDSNISTSLKMAPTKFTDKKFSSSTIQEKEDFLNELLEAGVYNELTLSSVIEVMNSYKTYRTAVIFYDLVIRLCKIDQWNPEWTALDWKLVSFSVIDFVLGQYFENIGKVFISAYTQKKYCNLTLGWWAWLDWGSCDENQSSYSLFVEMTITWCLAHPDETDNIRKIVDKHLCFDNIPSLYKKHILLPTIKYLVPDFVDGCKHSGECTAFNNNNDVKYNKCQAFCSALYVLKEFDEHVVRLVEGKGVEFYYNRNQYEYPSKLSGAGGYYPGRRTGPNKGIIFSPDKLHSMPYPYYREFHSMETVKELIKGDTLNEVYWMIST